VGTRDSALDGMAWPACDPLTTFMASADEFKSHAASGYDCEP
jgi:hypothetical protein